MSVTIRPGDQYKLWSVAEVGLAGAAPSHHASPHLSAAFAHAQDGAGSTAAADPQALADAIGQEVAQIRGLAFKQSVGVEMQSGAQFAEYLAGSVNEVVPETLMRHYGKIVQTLWLYRGGRDRSREVLARVAGMQANLSIDRIRAMFQQPQMAQLLGEDMQAAVQSTGEIPPFILEVLMGAYLKGMGFVLAVQEQGWSAVEKLYTEYPPQSTEHILHPEKWLAREAAVTIEWPDLARVAGLRESESAAAGWGGDRYAVFKGKDADSMLLLLRTAWDSEADATELVETYRRLLSVKCANTLTATRVVQRGVDVFVVEGGKESDIDSLLSVVRKAKKT